MKRLETHFTDIGGAQIAYCENGSGPILILLHGNSESKAIFREYQGEHFRDHHTYALDSRGHGETRSEDEQYSIRGYSEDVIAFCKVKGISEAKVVGYSDGGNIALFLAVKAPEIFRQVVAISPNTLASGTTDSTLRVFRAIRQALRLLGRLGFNTRKELLRMDLMLTDIGLGAEELGGIRTRLRILYAEHDLIQESHILEIARQVEGATVRKIGKCNHMTILNKKEAIADIRATLGG